MNPRHRRDVTQGLAGISGAPQLTLAKIIIIAEAVADIFALPFLMAGAFVAAAWFGLFALLYPWAHLVALVFFVVVFMRALRKARQNWKPLSEGLAKRRVEEATGLTHRPLDVIEDRIAGDDPDQRILWQAHQNAAREQLATLGWPRWKLSFANRDLYALRYALLSMLVISLAFGWGALGHRIIGAINPALGKLQMMSATLDAWITPPDYTHAPPIMIATPAGARHDGDTITIPEGSVISAHLAEKDDGTPQLSVNGETSGFTADDEHDFSAEQVIHSGDRITIRRGWQVLGSWRVKVVKDQPPQVSLNEPPAVSEHKSIRLNYTAQDDFGVASVEMRVIPRESMPGVSNDPISVPLSSPDTKQITRVSFEDLTSHPWAGMAVQIQLIAKDALGQVGQSEPVDFTLPERIFTHPVARALIEERKKILLAPTDDATRNEAANIMAGVAHQPDNYRGDPVVLMSLRAGAVRLVLDHSDDAVSSVAAILWQSAVRIEDGATGLAEQNLRKAQQDLADALDRNASEDEIQKLVAKTREALNQYMAELATRMAARPGSADDLDQMLGDQAHVLTPKDLNQMLDDMRNLAATGNREEARQQLARMQQMLENLRAGPPQLTEQQKQALQSMKALRDLQKQEQQLVDKTFRSQQSGDKKQTEALAAEQNNLLQQLQKLLPGLKDQAGQDATRGAQEMGQAGKELSADNASAALPAENRAEQALEAALQGMKDDLQSSMLQLPMPGMGEKMGDSMRGRYDPFSRGFKPYDDHSVKVPDQMQMRRVQEILDELQKRSGDMSRSRIEHDYIQRLLQNF